MQPPCGNPSGLFAPAIPNPIHQQTTMKPIGLICLALAALWLPAQAEYTVFRVCEDHHVIHTSDGADAGRVEYIVVEPATHRLVSAIITGGVLESRLIPVPVAAFHFGPEREVILTDITRERLIAAPVIEAARLSSTTVIEPTIVERTFTHFGVNPADISRTTTSTSGGATTERSATTTTSPPTTSTAPTDATATSRMRSETSATSTDRARSTARGSSADRTPQSEEAATQRNRNRSATTEADSPRTNRSTDATATDSGSSTRSRRSSSTTTRRSTDTEEPSTSTTTPRSTEPEATTTAPGRADTAPGRSRQTPGQSEAEAPGRAGTTPGQSEATPGQTRNAPREADSANSPSSRARGTDRDQESKRPDDSASDETKHKRNRSPE